MQPHAVKVSGNLGVRLGTYNANGISNRRDPFQYLIRGGIDINIADWHIPIGFRLSQQESAFFQPFHHYGMSPRYKWLRLHLGYRNLSFSQYTLNGHLFLGAGAEVKLPTLTGPVIRLKAMAGRFRRAVDPQDAFLNNGITSFKRTGYAAQIHLADRKNQRNYVSVEMVNAKDDASSIDNLFFDYNVQPEENFVLGFSGQINPVKRIVLGGQYGISAHTGNSRFDETSADLPTILKPFEGLFESNVSTEVNHALKLKGQYLGKTFKSGIVYERIDPAYQSFGSYYFQNDFENITINTSKNFSSINLNLSGSLGFQKNNLNEDKNTRTNRVIGSLSVSQSLFQRLSYSLSYNNYSSAVKSVRDLVSDSLNLYQITQSASAGINYLLSPHSSNTVLYSTVSRQVGNQRDEYRIFDNQTGFFNTTLGVRWRNPAKYLTLGAAFIYSTQESLSTERVLGPSITAEKLFFRRKLQATYNLTLSKNTKSGFEEYLLIDNRVKLRYNLKHFGSIGMLISHLDRNGQSDNSRTFSEFRTQLSYNYKFK